MKHAAWITALLLLVACAGPRPVTRGGMDQLARDITIVESQQEGTARGIEPY